jgi:hypothetical protein
MEYCHDFNSLGTLTIPILLICVFSPVNFVFSQGIIHLRRHAVQLAATAWWQPKLAWVIQLVLLLLAASSSAGQLTDLFTASWHWLLVFHCKRT